MFQVFDKDAGTFVDVREILDFTDEEFKENKEISKILDYMNTNNPVKSFSQNEIPSALSQTFASSKYNSYLKKTELSDAPTPGVNSEEQRATAIMMNRMTQFNTLTIPSFLDDFANLSDMSTEQKK